ncbi:hypothetical protein PED39_05460 [Methanomassiliicoccales archaeon LGM-RCC1]|nr:hypothetical protein PED39_05460 [Methanomassiliicoccales archaeon LGM-RCC1]
MIENVQQMRGVVEKALKTGKCYLEYPQHKIKEPTFAILSMVTNTPTLTEHDRTEVMNLITYNIHIYARSQTEIVDLASDVSDACAKIGFTRIGLTPAWNNPTMGPYRILTVQALLDKRGNTFTYS